MRAFAVLAICLLLAAPSGSAWADEVPSTLAPADQEAIHGVIQRQLDAFRADDAGTAFGFASPGIQGMFGDAGQFLAMVRKGYQPVYRPRSANFGSLVEIDGRTVQKLRLVGPDGVPTTAFYFMEREADGTWKIDGCQLQQSEAVGA